MAQRRAQRKEDTPCLEGRCNKDSYVFKVVLLGSTAVGKSSLAYRYVKKDFRDSLPTVGSDVHMAEAVLILKEAVPDLSLTYTEEYASQDGAFFTQVLGLDNTTVKLEIWDTAGQEKYHSVCHLYYRGANAALLVYDITRKESLKKAKVWLAELKKEFLPDEIIIALVGNKVDLSAEREVTLQEAKDFAQMKGLLYMETSAKSNYQVTELFTDLAHELLKQEHHREKTFQTTQWKKSCVDLRETSLPQTKCCRAI